jgi:hypothetical protein
MKPQSLDNVQRWMQTVITHPGGVEAGLAAPGAQSHLEIGAADVEQVVEPSRKESSIQRLAIYAEAYHTRLIECLQAEFPVFRQTVGDDIFVEFAVTYLQRHPSRSYTLGQLGVKFYQFLNETRPQDEPGELLSEWPLFLIDLARLERTISEVFDGPGVEGKPPILLDDLLAIDARRWPEAKLVTAPCLRLLSLQFPVNDYYTAVKSHGETAIPARGDSWLAITRRDYVVRRYELNGPQFRLLEALQNGQTIGEAIAAAADAHDGDIEQLAGELREWFRIWTAAPMFERLAISN